MDILNFFAKSWLLSMFFLFLACDKPREAYEENFAVEASIIEASTEVEALFYHQQIQLLGFKINQAIALDLAFDDFFECATVSLDTLKNDSTGVDTLSFLISFPFGFCASEWENDLSGTLSAKLVGAYTELGFYQFMESEELNFASKRFVFREELRFLLAANDSIRHQKNTYINFISGAMEFFRLAQFVVGQPFADWNQDLTVFTLSGSAITENGNNIEFATNTQSEVVFPTMCNFPSDGKILIEPKNRISRVIDFQNANCMDSLALTVGNQVINFTVPLANP